MPGGVASHFVQILKGDHASARTRTLVALGLALLLFAPAWFIYGGWQGLVVHLGGLLLGFMGGWLWGRSKVSQYEASIRGTWAQWMRFAVACESVPEIHRKVLGKSSRNLPYLYGGVLAAIWALELLLLVLAFQEDATHGMAIPVLLANGALAGALLGYALHVQQWYGQFRASVSELVDSGEIGVWGVL